MRHFVSLAVLLAALLLFAMTMHASDQNAGALSQEKCTACHDARRICFRLGKQDVAYWTATVAKMKAAGAKVDEGQAAAIAAWLAASGQSATPLCP